MGSYGSLKILAIADDATGALEVGGQLAAGGVRSMVTTERRADLQVEGLVVDLETRHLSGSEAHQSVAWMAGEARQARVPFLYKKIDSTLRGHIASEFQALLDGFPERLLVYVPAYPRMRRVVTKGELFVDGKPLAETAFAHDSLNPSRTGSIPALLADGCRAAVAVARSSGELSNLLRERPSGSVVVCDGATDDDLRSSAAVLAGSSRACIVAGTGGFVGEWAARLPVVRNYLPARRRIASGLVVQGSLHPISREQVRQAAGVIPVAYLDQELAASDLAIQKWAALATTGDLPPGVARRLGEMVREVLASRPVDALVIFGGDTALAVLAALGVTAVESIGELLPGIPLSLAAYAGRPLVLATKAGGFGWPDTLLEIKQQLEGES